MIGIPTVGPALSLVTRTVGKAVLRATRDTMIEAIEVATHVKMVNNTFAAFFDTIRMTDCIKIWHQKHTELDTIQEYRSRKKNAAAAFDKPPQTESESDESSSD